MYYYFIIYFVLLLPDTTYALPNTEVKINVIYLIDYYLLDILQYIV